MELHEFCSTSRVVIVVGKGGVGSTTVTATLATVAASAGASVLIVEVEGKSGLATCFASPQLEYAPQDVAPGIRARTITPDQALLEYLEERGFRGVLRQLLRTGLPELVSSAVPGMKDILVLGKVKQLEETGGADLIVVDAPASGHAIQFLQSPAGLLDAVRVGPIRAQAQEVIDLVTDAARCQVLLVTRPEETAVGELAETAFTLEDRVGVKLGPVIMNGVPPDLDLDGCSSDEDARIAGISLPAPEIEALDAAADFARRRHELAVAQATRLRDRLPLPQISLPFLFDEIGPAEIDQLADAFRSGVLACPRT